MGFYPRGCAGVGYERSGSAGADGDKGALIARLSEPGVGDQVAAAEARVAQVRADLEVLNKGGNRAN